MASLGLNELNDIYIEIINMASGNDKDCILPSRLRMDFNVND